MFLLCEICIKSKANNFFEKMLHIFCIYMQKDSIIKSELQLWWIIQGWQQAMNKAICWGKREKKERLESINSFVQKYEFT